MPARASSARNTGSFTQCRPTETRAAKQMHQIAAPQKKPAKNPIVARKVACAVAVTPAPSPSQKATAKGLVSEKNAPVTKSPPARVPYG